MPSQITHIVKRNDDLSTESLGIGGVIVDFGWFCVNGGLSIGLVLLGGLFAGLTIALMGQDKVTLQVLAKSGKGAQARDAEKVLSLLKRGKHWILVTLLLGNVITNETLPVLLDHNLKGGWLAVCMSTLLIVVFGEIIPQSICAKYGLAIGARSSTLVLWLMYTLSPIGYPTARLLDLLLGEHHGTTFSRAGLKTLIMLHEISLASPLTERLNQAEVSTLCSFLDMHSKKISSIMTPFPRVFTLSTDTFLNDRTRYEILKSGYAVIPVRLPGDAGLLVGYLEVRSLVALDSHSDVTAGEVELKPLVAVGPDANCQDVVLQVFGKRRCEMVVVTEGGRSEGRPLGVLTYRDVMEELMGGEMCSR